MGSGSRTLGTLLDTMQKVCRVSYSCNYFIFNMLNTYQIYRTLPFWQSLVKGVPKCGIEIASKSINAIAQSGNNLFSHKPIMGYTCLVDVRGMTRWQTQ